MRNEATLWLAKYMEDHGISTEKISRELHIPKKKLIPGTKESLDADEFLALCSYLQINPQGSRSGKVIRRKRTSARLAFLNW